MYNYYEKQYNRKSFGSIINENNIEMILCNNIVDIGIDLISEPAYDKYTINEWIDKYDNDYDILNIYEVSNVNELTDNDYKDIDCDYHYDIQNDLGIYDDVYQYFIIHDNDTQFFENLDYPVYYCDTLDLYVVGITHYGTSWHYILTNVPIEVES